MELVETATGVDPSPLVRKLAANVLLSPEETRFIEELQTNVVEIKRGQKLFQENDDLATAFVIASGWCIRQHTTPRGRRQILGVSLPGDFLALRVNFQRQARYTALALTDLRIAVIEPMRIIDVYQRYPVIASGLDWSTVREMNILSEHNISLGARHAPHRIAHFCLELWCRLMLIGEADQSGFDHALTQEQLADTMGLSVVHTNKMLRQLNDMKLINWGRNRVEFTDIDGAFEYADFDPRFLHSFRLTHSIANNDEGTSANTDHLGMARVVKPYHSPE
ncbi:MAG: Crp/Fnr family transcriptional regulator [Pseudomonadota bacterium]